MKKTVLKFGLISGAIFVAFMVGTMPFVDKIGFDSGMVIGYTSMVLAFLLVFFGIRSYRESAAGGYISFGKAFQVGILITLISCICYVVSWQIVYFNFLPDFFEKYANHTVETLKASGASAEEVTNKANEMQRMKVWYDKPLFNAGVTFLEPFPVGLLVTFISALVLRRRPKPELDQAEQPLAQQNG
jgi:Protein of unknown function (DUF4199)